MKCYFTDVKLLIDIIYFPKNIINVRKGWGEMMGTKSIDILLVEDDISLIDGLEIL